MRQNINTQDGYTTFTIREMDLKGQGSDCSIARIEVKHDNGKSSFVHIRVALDDKYRLHVETAVNKDDLRSLRKDIMVALKNQVNTNHHQQRLNLL